MPRRPRSHRTTTASRASTRRLQATSTRPADPGRPRRSPPSRFRLLGGKGGVGKTTCAAAIAVTAARSGQRTLIISTDPASSLGDALDAGLSSAPRRIPLEGGVLDALEVDAARAIERWLSRRRAGFERMALRGTWLDREDVSALLGLSLPGIDELAALLETHRYAEAGQYDLIVLDTAPTGHTLRMLAMPESLRSLARVFDLMQSKHRTVVEALRGRWDPDADDALIEDIDRTGQALKSWLRDRERMHMTWVTLPEPMSIEETADAAGALDAAGIPLRDVIVNQLTPAPARPCGWCDGRQRLERQALLDLARRLAGTPIRAVASRPEEPRGVAALARIGREIAAGRLPRERHRISRRRVWRAADVAGEATGLPPVSGASTRLILFGGKGGVGKTTCAAAAAIAAASEPRDRRVILLSTDPAHSLADVFEIALGDAATAPWPRTPKLLVQELDAATRFERLRERYAASADALFDRLTRQQSRAVDIDVGQDRRVMRSLIDLAPPGIDELAAIIEVAEAIDPESSDLLIMDTAPSGHALRLLEMPGLVQQWVQALMSILLKYRPVAGVGDLGAVLLRLSKGLGRLRVLLADPARTSFVVVTRPAALPRLETVRLLRRLRRLGIHVPLVLVNAAGRGTCARCRRGARLQQREIDALTGQLPKMLPIAIAPVELPPPRGAAALRLWHRTWRRHPKPLDARAISSRRIP